MRSFTLPARSDERRQVPGCRNGRRRAEQMEAPIHVLILERQRLVAESLRQALESMDPALKIVGVAATHEEASTLARRHRPQVVLVDSQLAEETAELPLPVHNEAAIVMLGNDDAEQELLKAVEARWRGYVNKQVSLPALLTVIRRTAAGELVMPADLLYRAIQRQSLRQSRKESNGADDEANQLSAREREVLELIGRGMDNKSIALALGIRLTTARSHVQRVLEKLGVHSKLQAMRYANGNRLGETAVDRPWAASERLSRRGAPRPRADRERSSLAQRVRVISSDQ
jgi:DNA-binding NarL/FixJ family response regulator